MNTQEIGKRIDKIEQTLDTIQNNHLAHIQRDMRVIKWFFGFLTVITVAVSGWVAYTLYL